MAGTVLSIKEPPLGWVVFSNPERRNALSYAMNEQTREIVDAFASDPEVRVVVMRGEGERAFVSGADISEFETMRNTQDAQQSYDRAMGRAAASMARLEKPLVAMIHGYCIGGGLATALRADVRIASEDARLAIPAARLGLGYAFGGINALVQLVGPAWASEIMLSARQLDASEALRIGLVNRVVPSGELESAVRLLAGQMADNAPLTIRAAKAAIAEAVKDPGRRDLERVARLVAECFASDDYVEGRRAFMEKRTPRFTGR